MSPGWPEWLSDRSAWKDAIIMTDITETVTDTDAEAWSLPLAASGLPVVLTGIAEAQSP